METNAEIQEPIAQAVQVEDLQDVMKISTKDGYAIINVSDFDEKTMKPFAEKEPAKHKKSE